MGPRLAGSANFRSLAAAFVIGGLLAGLCSLWVLYDRTGKRVVNRVLNLAGRGTPPAVSEEKVRLAQLDWGGVKSPTSPQWKVRRGYDVALASRGFTFPVNIAFVPKPQSSPDAPFYYVNELHGTIKYVTRGGAIQTYATGLTTNIDPNAKSLPNDEMGLTGLMIIPGSEDLLVTGSYVDPESGLLFNHILRLVSEPGGRRLREVKILLDLKEVTAPSHQIQQVVAGSDGKLYVSVGDGENRGFSLALDRFGGKILRLNFDGSACEDNPFYDRNSAESPQSYIYAYGLRNAFGFDIEPSSGELFAADNGMELDRVIHVVRGGNYRWKGDDESMRSNAIFTWGPTMNPCPVGVAFSRQAVLGGSESRNEQVGGDGQNAIRTMYIGLMGPTRPGKNQGKSIVEFAINSKTAMLERGPEPVIQYDGEALTNVLGLAEGPDGLYFTDLYGETPGKGDPTGKGRVWKVFRSEATLKLVAAASLEGLAPIERGQVLFSRNCATCHRVGGVGGYAGPELTHVMTNLADRLNEELYATKVDRLLKSNKPFIVEQRSKLQAVLGAKDEKRTRVWLEHHLEEPRFDNPYARMPSFAALPMQDREHIIAFLSTLD
jgi:Glucose / Sorbosone dehydrogenase/Cytochrome c